MIPVAADWFLLWIFLWNLLFSLAAIGHLSYRTIYHYATTTTNNSRQQLNLVRGKRQSIRGRNLAWSDIRCIIYKLVARNWLETLVYPLDSLYVTASQIKRRVDDRNTQREEGERKTWWINGEEGGWFIYFDSLSLLSFLFHCSWVSSYSLASVWINCWVRAHIHMCVCVPYIVSQLGQRWCRKLFCSSLSSWHHEWRYFLSVCVSPQGKTRRRRKGRKTSTKTYQMSIDDRLCQTSGKEGRRGKGLQGISESSLFYLTWWRQQLRREDGVWGVNMKGRGREWDDSRNSMQ